MSRQRRHAPQLDLDELPPGVRAAVEAAIAGDDITLTRSGGPIGSLEFHSIVLEGTVVDGPAPRPAPTPIPDGVTVVATTMALSDTASRRLSDEFGADYLVLDLHEAPTSTNVLLTHPVSPQLLGHLQHQFPHARIVITEIDDEELGVHYPGPVSRLLDAGAAAYLPPRPIAEIAANVHAYLTQSDQPALESRRRPKPGLSPTQHRPIGR